MAGLLAKMFGSAVGSTVKDVTDGVGGLALNLRSAITGELPPGVRGKLEVMASEAEAIAIKGQGEVNKIEAQSKSLFLAGWRPALAWVCVVGLAFHFIITPIIQWIAILAGSTIVGPEVDAAKLMNLVLALLGLGGMRSYEKKHKVHELH